MNTRQRISIAIVVSCAATLALQAISCDPGYNSKKNKGVGGAPGTGGEGQPGSGGTPPRGLGGETGTGGDNTSGVGGDNGGGVGGDRGGTGGMNGGGTGGMTGAGGGAASIVTGGDFSTPNDPKWTFMRTAGSGNEPAHGVQNGQYCVTMTPSQSVIVGWPDMPSNTADLPSGKTYTFSYMVSTQGSVTVSVRGKVGSFDPPNYIADFDQTDLMNVTNANMTITHTFTTDHEDVHMGIGMFIDSGGGNGNNRVCLDNITLIPQ